jgi:hypothetical protein
MRGMPPLQDMNRYTCLEIEDNIIDSLDVPEPTVMPKEALKTKTRLRGWEKRLLKWLVLTSTPGNRSLNLSIKLQTTDMQETKAAKALLDCGASGLFMGKDYIAHKGLKMRKLSELIEVMNVDGMLNQAGPITEIVDVIFRYKGHSEYAIFAVTQTSKDNIILGLPWLKQHNPEDGRGKNDSMPCTMPEMSRQNKEGKNGEKETPRKDRVLSGRPNATPTRHSQRR